MIIPYDDQRRFSPDSPDLRQTVVADQPETVPSFSATMGAAFRQDNLVGSLLANRDANLQELYRQEPDFDPFNEIKGTDYEAYTDRFTDIFNRKAFESRKAQIDMEREDRRTLDASGFWGDLASMGAAVADPTMALPGGTLYRGVKGGYAFGKSALSLGAAAAGAAAASEAGLQATQQIRPLSESAFAIGGSAVLGAALGGTVATFLTRAERRTLSEGIDRLARTEAPDAQLENEGVVSGLFQSAGAAAAPKETLEGLSIAGKAAGGVGKASAWARLNPLVRLLDSPSVEARSIATGLMENPVYLKKNIEGVASEAAVETLVKEYSQGAVARAMTEMDRLHTAYRGKGGALARDEFRQAVGMAMRRGDRAIAQPGEELIDEAAQAWRKTVFDPLKEQAIELGILPEDVQVSTAESYLSRLWNWRKIEDNEAQFKNVVSKWIDGELTKATDRATKSMDSRLGIIDGELNDLRLPAEERAKLLETLPEQLKQLEAANQQFAPLEERLRPLRQQEFAARRAGQRSQAASLREQIAAETAQGGDSYAQYVTARNAIRTRLHRIRNNLVGRQDQVEQISGRIADQEAANVDRLWRMHRSLSLLERRMEAEGPESVADELSAARTRFAEILDKSNREQERFAQARQRREAEMQKAAEAGNVDRAVEIERQLNMGDPFMAEAKRIAKMSDLAARIEDLEKVDPEEALSEIKTLIERRIAQAAAVVEDSTKRMMALIERMQKADPKLVEDRIKALEARKAEVRSRYSDKFIDEGDRKAYVEEIVDEVYNRLTGREQGDIPRDIVPTKRGPLKERTFNIPDRLVEDFIESDVELIGRRYARVMSADIELTRKYGSPAMKDALKRITDQYTELRKVTTDTKALRKLNSREKRDIRDLKAVRDMLRGMYRVEENQGPGARIGAVFNTLNYLRAMGGVVLSSLTDVARPLMVHGLSRYMADGVVPLVRNLKVVKMSVKEARLAGAVAERILNTRIATLAEITDPYSMSSPFERFLENSAKQFSRLNGMVYWNDFMKSFAATMTQNRILQGAVDFAKAGATEKSYLAYLGIDGSMAERIAKEFDAHGLIEDGVHIANTEDWTDTVARRAYRAAVNKDVDSIIVTKGIGDVPLFSRTPVGRAVLQFKGFALASHQRAFMRGLQAAELGTDSRSGAIAGFIASTAIGSFIYYLKSVESNRLDDLSDNPGRFIAEGLDRSGLLAVPFEINNTVEKAFGIGAYGALQAAFPDKEQSGKASRYAVRSVAAGFTGPTGDFVDTLVKVSNALKNGDLKESDVNAIRRLAPGGTLPVIRSLLEYEALPAAREAVRD